MKNTNQKVSLDKDKRIQVEKPKVADPHIKFNVTLEPNTSGTSRYCTATIHVLTYKSKDGGGYKVGQPRIASKTIAIDADNFDLEIEFTDVLWDKEVDVKPWLPYNLMISMHDTNGDMGKSFIAGGRFKPANHYDDDQESTIVGENLYYTPGELPTGE